MSHVKNMLLNLESSKALLSTVKVMIINARVVVSSLNAQYRFFFSLLFRVEKKYAQPKAVGGLVTVNGVCADCSSLF